MVEQLNLDARKAELLTKVRAAAEAGDLDLVATLGREVSNLGKAVRIESDKATETVRAQAKDSLTKALGSKELTAAIRDALRQSVISINVKRSATGLDDGKASITASQVYDVVMPHIQEAVGPVDSIRRVEVSFTNGQPKVEVFTTSGTAKPKAPGATSNTGAKGWSKDGIQYKLADIFTKEATEAQKLELVSFNKDGNKEYALKKAVATKAGYAQG